MAKVCYLTTMRRGQHVVSYHDGVKTHKDGSPFYDGRVYKRIETARRFLRKLLTEGYSDKY